MKDDIQIQNLQSRHLSLIAQWQHSEREKHGNAGSLSARERRLREHIRIAGSNAFPVTYVAIFQGEAIGCCSLIQYGLSTSHCAQANDLWLSNVYVCSDYRRRGVAEKLISYSQKQANLAGIETLKLFTSNAAEYYRNRGWQSAGVARVGREDMEIFKCTP